MVDPENVSRDNLNPSRLHFQNLFFPLAFGITGIVKLSHHRKPRLPVTHEIAVVDGEYVAIRRPSARGERKRLRQRSGNPGLDDDWRRGAWSSAKASSAKLGAITAMTSASRCGLRVRPRLPLHNSVFMAILGHQSKTRLPGRNSPKVGLPTPWRRATSLFSDPSWFGESKDVWLSPWGPPCTPVYPVVQGFRWHLIRVSLRSPSPSTIDWEEMPRF